MLLSTITWMRLTPVKNMKTIEYSQHGRAHSDYSAERIVREFLQGEDEYLHVSTENVIMAARVLIREGVIAHDQIRFFFQEEYIQPARSGGLPHWPVGFCDKIDNWLCRLL